MNDALAKQGFARSMCGGVGPRRCARWKTFLNAVTVQYAKELRDTNILINAACPGFTATDLNGFRGVRTPEQGAAARPQSP